MRNDQRVLVILDSTVLVADRFLQSNDLRLLLNAARGGELRVGVTEVTLREAVNKVRENADEALGRIRRGAESLTKLRVPTADFITDVTPEGVANEYERFLTETFTANAVEVFNTPPVPHDDVVTRALWRRKPFDENGHVGYRDALIWETIKQVAIDTAEEIAFILRNHRDFAESGKGSGLGRALADELTEAGVTAPVELFLEVKSFVEVGLRPAAEALAELRMRLDGDSEFRAQLEHDIEKAIDRDDPDLTGIDVRRLVDERWAEYELEEAVLHAVSPGVTQIDIVSARSLNEDEVLLDLVAEGDADVEFRARRISGGWPAGDIDEFDDDNAPRKISGTKARSLNLTVEATYRNSRAVERVRVTSAATIGDPETDRRERFHSHIARGPERRAWERRAHAAALQWARAEGFASPWGESDTSLDFRNGSRVDGQPCRRARHDDLAESGRKATRPEAPHDGRGKRAYCDRAGGGARRGDRDATLECLRPADRALLARGRRVATALTRIGHHAVPAVPAAELSACAEILPDVEGLQGNSGANSRKVQRSRRTVALAIARTRASRRDSVGFRCGRRLSHKAV
jgi:hypothetical protein